ncbi:protein rolling stone-like [Coccinella septempunctata]|uniref:protein rolling stone-like n=1 Tax=Coccinella septempunctata TaxID=41139 RepID=UPI001D076A9A|nr:protein rolling stone-like [Coccinella septempunctata]XP_044765498.1 protein rolling stone-like [Coccinella septempunctata]XP_044765500.1 protein rolling stone-like [Coccinella septempunctata]XP_044765501.1 protein rolling stone-like [Coccinella septempunctata]XP_044765502.1 protein rolling stone-like [Coccinella septempunctata]XP_044765503.1 protein rolling stone-like [Coccinella septempunctata]XP_044765504.1 protein rolling stone-like [Coccinella septempunctata]
MLSKWKNKFTSQEFGLTHKDPEIFVICQWQHKNTPSIWYLLYRWLVVIYFITTWLLSILIVKTKTDSYQLKWLIYLTHWGYTTCTFQALLAAFMLTSCVLAHKKKPYKPSKDGAFTCYKLYWAFNTIATVLACVITIVYWSFIYNPAKNPLDVMNFILHGMNTVLMLFDFWLVSHPTRIAHCIYPMMFVTVYAIFSVIYYLAGGTSRDGTDYIYPILKWELPFRTLLVCAGVGIFIFALQTFFFLMYLLKKRVHKKLGRRKSIELNSSSPRCDGYVNEAVIAGDEV